MSNQEVDITLQDLHQIKRIIEVVCQRGAIQAMEMETVGNIYNKLTKLLDTKQPETESNKKLPTP